MTAAATVAVAGTPWPVLAAVALATAGLLVLGVLAIRLWRDAAVLAREVDAAARALAAASGELAGSLRS